MERATRRRAPLPNQTQTEHLSWETDRRLERDGASHGMTCQDRRIQFEGLDKFHDFPRVIVNGMVTNAFRLAMTGKVDCKDALVVHSADLRRPE